MQAYMYVCHVDFRNLGSRTELNFQRYKSTSGSLGLEKQGEILLYGAFSSFLVGKKTPPQNGLKLRLALPELKINLKLKVTRTKNLVLKGCGS